MTNGMSNVTDNQILAPSAPQRPLGDRLRELTDADLKMIQGQGVGVEFNNTFDNAFKNGFKNVA
jgi:hypothetical protein